MNDTREAWNEWLNSFRERFIAEKGWTAKDAKRCLLDGWVVVRDGRAHALTEGSQRPADAVPVFEMLTPGGWKPPIQIIDRLTDLIAKAMSSQRSPRVIVLGLLDLANHADGPDVSTCVLAAIANSAVHFNARGEPYSEEGGIL